MLNKFFNINLPYGIAKNHDGCWMAFNREYLPIGYNDYSLKKFPGIDYLELPVYTKYVGITENFLINLADKNNTGSIQRNDKGEIIRVFLYNDASNPVNRITSNKILWNNYFIKLEKLSKLKIAT